jgi:DNA-directed RNA polymerase sigma subunit (sigma70/sigma32)
MIIMRSTHGVPEYKHWDTRLDASHGGSATRRFDPTESLGGVRVYLREIGRIPLLTRQEETELAGLIKKGDKKARDRMIKANLRLVVRIAYRYAGFGWPLLDLISEGSSALITAVERFDPADGDRFSTYASSWIKHRIERSLAVRPTSPCITPREAWVSSHHPHTISHFGSSEIAAKGNHG